MLIFFHNTGSKEMVRYSTSIIIPRVGEMVQLESVDNGLCTKVAYNVVNVEYRYNEKRLQDILVFLKRWQQQWRQ
ncbi:hypothetical protein GNF82_13970 [Clostridium perfringens]